MPLGGESGARLLRYQMLLVTYSVHIAEQMQPMRSGSFACCPFPVSRICNRANQGGCYTTVSKYQFLRTPYQPWSGKPRLVPDVQQTATHAPGGCTKTEVVVPHSSMETWTAQARSRGDERNLHGWLHLCDRLPAAGLASSRPQSSPSIRQPDMSLICNYC